MFVHVITLYVLILSFIFPFLGEREETARRESGSSKKERRETEREGRKGETRETAKEKGKGNEGAQETNGSRV